MKNGLMLLAAGIALAVSSLAAGEAAAQITDPQNSCLNSPSAGLCDERDIQINAERSQLNLQQNLDQGQRLNALDNAMFGNPGAPGLQEILIGDPNFDGDGLEGTVLANEQRSLLNQTQLRAAEDRIGAVEEDVDDLQAQTLDHEGRITANTTRSEATEDRSISNRDRITTTEGQIRQLNPRVGANTTRSERNDDAIFVRRSDGTIARNRIEDNETRSERNERDIEATQDFVVGVAELAVDNSFRIDAFEELAAGLQGYEHRIGDLEKRVDDLEDRIDQTGAIITALDNPGMPDGGAGKVAIYGGAGTVNGAVGFGLGLNYQVTTSLRVYGGGGTDRQLNNYVGKIGGVYTLN